MRTYFLIVGLGCALVLGARAIGSPSPVPVADAQTAQTVTTYSGTIVLSMAMPGTSNGGGGLDFPASGTLSNLQFAPGTKTFNGQPVTFSGNESAFMSTTLTGTITFPVSSGPCIVGTTCSLSSSGAVNGSWNSADQGVSLGSNFSASNLDWVLGSTPGGNATNSSWQSTVIPQLNNASVTAGGNGEVMSVDAANGIVAVSASGAITAMAQAACPPPPPGPGPGPIPQ